MANEESAAERLDQSPAAGAPAARESADDATVADLLEFVNLAKRVHADLGGVPLGSPTKAHADEDDDADEDLGSPPKKRKTETGLASVMEDDDDAAGALLAGANPWMHAPPVVSAADPGPGRPDPVKGTIGSDDKEPVDGTKAAKDGATRGGASGGARRAPRQSRGGARSCRRARGAEGAPRGRG